MSVGSLGLYITLLGLNKNGGGEHTSDSYCTLKHRFDGVHSVVFTVSTAACVDL